MKKIHRVTTIYFSFMLLGVLQACTGDECGGSGGSINFEIVSVENYVVRLTAIEEGGEFYNYESYQEGDTIEYQELGIVLTPLTEPIAVNYTYSNFFFGTALACSPPPPPAYGNITDIEVRTLSNYDSQYQSNSILDEIILAGETFRTLGLTIDPFLNFNSGRKYYGGSFLLRLNRPPENILPIEFEISITINNERTYNTTVKNVIIQP